MKYHTLMKIAERRTTFTFYVQVLGFSWISTFGTRKQDAVCQEYMAPHLLKKELSEEHSSVIPIRC